MIRAVAILLFAGAALGFQAEPTNGNGRIVGGTATDITKYPYQVSIQVNGRHYCGGSVLNANYILTAAHCAGSKGIYKVRVGSSLHNSGGVVLDVAEIIKHEKYRSLITDYDVAVFRLAAPLEFSAVVQPVALVAKDEELPAGTPSVVTGWGDLEEDGSAPDVLQEVEVPLLNNADCKKFYPLILTSRMICAGFTEGGRDACQGDSGGPLVVNGGRQVGVVSWGIGCARSNAPGVYARVAVLRDWIAEKSGA